MSWSVSSPELSRLKAEVASAAASGLSKNKTARIAARRVQDLC
jgi:hypothetical protein